MRAYISGTKNFCTIQNHINAPILKTIFDCENTENVKIEISVVGFYRLFLNGKEITNGFLCPYVFNPDDVVYYEEYDVSKLLKPTKNVLSDFGRTDLAYEMITVDTHPSFGNILKQGATGMWGKFTEYIETDEGMRQKDGWIRNYSLNHPVFGGISSWFMEYLAGIRIVSFDKIEINPCFIDKITDVYAKFENGDKAVSVKIEVVDGKRKVTVYNRGFDCKITNGEIICENDKTTSKFF